MKGSIRIAVGLFIAYGAVGTLDVDPTASVLTQGLVAAVGLLIMASGAKAASKNA